MSNVGKNKARSGKSEVRGPRSGVGGRKPSTKHQARGTTSGAPWRTDAGGRPRNPSVGAPTASSGLAPGMNSARSASGGQVVLHLMDFGCGIPVGAPTASSGLRPEKFPPEAAGGRFRQRRTGSPRPGGVAGDAPGVRVSESGGIGVWGCRGVGVERTKKTPRSALVSV